MANMATRRRARVPVAVAGVLAVAVVAGCGNRVPHDEVAAVGNGYGPVDAQRDQSAVDAAGVPAGPGSDSGAPPLAAGPADPAIGAAVPGAAPGSVPNATPQSSGGSASGPRQTAGPGAAPADAAKCQGPLSPIRLGQTLATSGLVGASIGGLRTGLAVWAKDVNSRGGVQCHPIQLTQLDDGSDAARVAANWNTLVNIQKSVAVLGAGTPVAIAALVSSAERDKVAVIGTDLQGEEYFKSQYVFPQGGLPLSAYDGSYVLAAQQAGGGTSGLLYCVEVSICSSLKNNHPKATERAELKSGPQVAASLTQPDYTSECQTMKQAGVTVLFIALDGSGSIRAARSCLSLGYKPVIASSAIAVSALAAADKNLQQLGTYLGTNNVPFMSKDSSAAIEFRAAMQRYAPGSSLDEPALFGWASGKLFEAALAKVATKARAGEVTKDMVLEGLWQLKNEKLGGLGPGVSFAQGKLPMAADCFYGVKLGTDGFTDPIGSKPKCFGSPEPKPASQESGGAQPAAADPSTGRTFGTQRSNSARGRRPQV